jgi:Uma2 family endonuclease
VAGETAMAIVPLSVEEETRAPIRQRASYEEYLRQASDSRIAEWVDGEMITYMPPLLKHQEVNGFLYSLLRNFVELLRLGFVGIAPFEIKLWPGGPSREPDVFFVRQDRLEQLTDKRFEGAPDLVVEIVSKGSVREDKVRKFGHYEQAGVREYWLFDPRPRYQTADFFLLNEDGIFETVEIDDDGRFYSAVLPDFWLNMDWLWEEPLPYYQRALAEIFASSDSFPAELKRLFQSWADYLRPLS